MNDYSLTLVQSILFWEDKESNFRLFDEHLDMLEDPTDLIVLPEMFTTGFTMKPQNLAETMHGPSIQWMKNKASELSCSITGSLIILEDGKYHNRLVWVKPDHTIYTYDKRHLFTMAGEHETYQAGNDVLIVEDRGWRICPMICYDLRFPVWARNSALYDVLIFTANWPVMRIDAWKSLLCARAIENQAYVTGVNRIGQDGNGYPYCGNSRIYNAEGHLVLDAKEASGLFTMSLSRSHLDETRHRLPFLADRDDFIISTR